MAYNERIAFLSFSPGRLFGFGKLQTERLLYIFQPSPFKNAVVPSGLTATGLVANLDPFSFFWKVISRNRLTYIAENVHILLFKHYLQVCHRNWSGVSQI